MSRMKQINLRSSREFWLLASRQSWRCRSIFRQIMLCFAPWCEVCVNAKGTGAQHRRQTIKELSKQEGWTQNLISDACVEIQQGRIAATALEQKGLTQYGVKFFAGFIQQTGVRRFINKSDGEPAMKAWKDAAPKALEGAENIGQEPPVGDDQANGDVESAVRTLEAQMRATRFGLESRLGRQLAHDDPILMWTMARRLGKESKVESGLEIH